jgi:hypothetical protein
MDKNVNKVDFIPSFEEGLSALFKKTDRYLNHSADRGGQTPVQLNKSTKQASDLPRSAAP